MPFVNSLKERRAQLEENAPETAAMIPEVQRYLAASHLSVVKLAEYIGYGVSTVRHWLRGSYHEVGGTDRYIRQALRDFMEANPIAATPENAGRFYETENVATMKKWFDHCLALRSGRGRMVGIYSGPGGQKTFIAENLVAQFNRDHLHNEKRPRAFHIYCSQDLTPSQLMIKLCETVGFAKANTLQTNFASLRFQFRQTRVLFIFDEAQHLSIPCLEIIRELNDIKPYFGVMLLGSHKLRQLFDQHASEMEQWNSRMTGFFELPGIGEDCARRIIHEELAGKVTVTEKRVATLIKSSYADDIYSREKKKYLSARRLFRSLEQIVEAAEAQPSVSSPEVVQ